MIKDIIFGTVGGLGLFLYGIHIMSDALQKAAGDKMDVTNWLIEYNFNRPHQALDYLTPMEYIANYNENLKQKVLPMCPASTII